MEQQGININFIVALHNGTCTQQYELRDYLLKSETNKAFASQMQPTSSMEKNLKDHLLDVTEAPEELLEQMKTFFTLIYDQQNVEYSATPQCLNMEDGDAVLVLENSIFANLKWDKRSTPYTLDNIRHNFNITRKQGSAREKSRPLIRHMFSMCEEEHKTTEHKDEGRNYIFNCIFYYFFLSE